MAENLLKATKYFVTRNFIQRHASDSYTPTQRVGYDSTTLVVVVRGGSIYRKHRKYIADIDILVSYRHFRYRFFDISISYRWQV